MFAAWSDAENFAMVARCYVEISRFVESKGPDILCAGIEEDRRIPTALGRKFLALGCRRLVLCRRAGASSVIGCATFNFVNFPVRICSGVNGTPLVDYQCLHL